MDAYFTGKILSAEKTEFTGTDGQPVAYYTYVIKNFAGGLLTINSAKDFTEFEGERCDIAIAMRQEGKLYKISLSGVKISEELETIE